MSHRTLAWLALVVAAFTLILQITARKPGPEEPAASLGWLLESERAFVRVLRGGRWDNRTMQAAMADFERLGAQDPFYGHHYLVYARWARERLEKAPKSYLTSYDLAMLRYLESREDPAEALLFLAGRRVDPASHYVPELYHQWSKGFFSSDRGRSLLDEILPHINPARLKGATVADIGSGPGQFARSLLDLVGDQGKVLAIDICPSVAEVQAPMALLDPDFARIHFRILPRGDRGVGVLPEEALDFAFLMDVHLFSFSPEESDPQFQEDWLEALHAALRPGGTFFLFESSGAPQALEQTLQWLTRSRLRGQEWSGPGLHGTSSFFVQVQKAEEAPPSSEPQG